MIEILKDFKVRQVHSPRLNELAAFLSILDHLKLSVLIARGGLRMIQGYQIFHNDLHVSFCLLVLDTCFGMAKNKIFFISPYATDH